MNKLKFSLLILAFFGLSNYKGLSQNNVNVWYFGEFQGIDFNSGAPVLLTNSAMDQEEGCATICNAVGSLLFYTNGIKIWNRNHVFMPNGTGLDGDISATQSGIIVPKPGSNTLYYVFTVDFLGGPKGLKYSEVDMTLNGGLGDVNANKNIPLTSPTAEKVTAVNHANNTDFWVITHGWNDNNFYAYAVTATGVNPVPVVSSVGIFNGGASLNSVGYLKGSHDGSIMASAVYASGTIEIFNFDNSTGQLTLMASLSSPAYANVYGIEFSPNNQYLYASMDVASGAVYQFDLSSGNPATIQASATLLANVLGGTTPGALQLAPDNKIYLARNNSIYLDYISNPDAAGAACGYVANGLFLGTNKSWYGLPNFIQNIFILPEIILGDSCLGDITTFSLTSLSNVDSVHWNFDDPASGANNFSSLVTPTHVFSGAGSYQPYVILFHSGVQDTVFTSITIVTPPSVNLGPDVQLCPGQTVNVDASFPGATVTWNDGFPSPQRTFSTAGTWSVTVSNRCGSPTDQITVNYFPQAVVTLRSDTTVCEGITVLLDAGTGYQSYAWSTGETTQQIIADMEGPYFVNVIDANGCPASDQFGLAIDACDQYLFMPTAFTPNGDLLNETFGPIVGGDKVKPQLFMIFDRWGNLIFESKGDPWNGKFRELSVPEGNYSWYLQYLDDKSKLVETTGMVTVIR